MDHVYDRRAFAAAMQNVVLALPTVEAAVSRMEPWASAWGFVIFPRFEVVLTLYGPGGSYDSNSGRVALFSDEQGHGRFGKPFADTIVHEIVHIGIQKRIVEAKGLSHQDKERLVDRLCMVAFSDILPGYQAQKMGTPALDAYVTPEALADLPSSVDRYLRDHAR